MWKEESEAGGRTARELKQKYEDERQEIEDEIKCGHCNEDLVDDRCMGCRSVQGTWVGSLSRHKCQLMIEQVFMLSQHPH